METPGKVGENRAVDREPRDRPGVPMLPEQVVAVGPLAVAQQVTSVPVLVGVDVGELTPVFSSAVPPRGLSGLMRRRAYAIPEHRARRWIMLLLADRVDVWEGRLARHRWLLAGLGVAALGVMASRRVRS